MWLFVTGNICFVYFTSQMLLSGFVMKQLCGWMYCSLCDCYLFVVSALLYHSGKLKQITQLSQHIGCNMAFPGLASLVILPTHRHCREPESGRTGLGYHSKPGTVKLHPRGHPYAQAPGKTPPHEACMHAHTHAHIHTHAHAQMTDTHTKYTHTHTQKIYVWQFRENVPLFTVSSCISRTLISRSLCSLN
jgi:hypothetical protein